MLRDSFYTPKVLADKLIQYVSTKNVNSVADFCVGDGELLRASNYRWPNAKCFGSDISLEAVQFVKSNHPSWEISKLDFLNKSSRNKSKIAKSNNEYDLIVLNPPFSCIGSTINKVEIDEISFFVSRAMNFVLEALKYLSPEGVLYAILPESVAYSQKDKGIWTYLEKNRNLTILEESSIKYFQGCTPNIILVSINDFSKVKKVKRTSKSSLKLLGAKVIRGTLPMNMLPLFKGDNYLIHTTNLQKNSIVNLSIKVKSNFSKIQGPAVLLPRVGSPNVLKICIINKEDTYVLSDCIIAINTKSKKESILLYKYLIGNWKVFSTLYKGTGAKYITVKKLKDFLRIG